MKFKKYLYIFPILAIILVFSGCKTQPAEPAEDNSSIIFFYGKECPHCQGVEEYFSKNNISDKVAFSQREVYHDASNAALMQIKAKECKLDEKNLGVPLLWADGKCYLGETEITQFFQNKINENN
jgi:glutaredoxin-related protein